MEKCSHSIHSALSTRYLITMAAKVIVALSCFALCHSSPLFLNGYLYRNGRAYLIGQGYTGNGDGKATGSASVNAGVLQAYGTASTDNQNQLNRNIGLGEAYPLPAVAKAQIYDYPPDTLYGRPYKANAFIETQNAPSYYAVPAPATIVSYEQNFNNPSEISYEFPTPGSIAAESSAVIDGNSESSHTSVRSDGSATAESSANTQGVGNYGVTSSNSNIYGTGFGSASSNIKNGYISTASKTNGFGSASSQSKSGLGSFSSETETNGGYGSASSSANNAFDSAMASSNTQGSGFATSKANINLQEISIYSPKRTPQKGISWKFGTQYQVPPNGGQVYANSQSMGGSSESLAQSNSHGNIQTNANTQGYGSANTKANLGVAGYMNSVSNANELGNSKSSASSNGISSINTAASTNGIGSSNAEAIVNGAPKSTSNTRFSPYGASNAQANINHGTGSVSSSATSNGFGQASSTANTGPAYGKIRYNMHDDGLYYGGFKTLAKTTGQGSASSSVRSQGVHAGYKVLNSSANSSGYGTAQANAQSF